MLNNKINKIYKISLFIFRRDLRLEDNTGLIEALNKSDYVIPCFILDPVQISDDNKYKSERSIQFMFESLLDLNDQLTKLKSKLYLFRDHPENIVKKLIKSERIDAVFVNQDYTPYSKSRDKKILEVCEINNVKFESYNDYLLNDPNNVKNKSGKPYLVFTPYFKQCLKINVDKPQKNNYKNFYYKNIDIEVPKAVFKGILKENKFLYVNGGRKNCTELLKNLSNFTDYLEYHDYPYYDTTLLSAHNKFGTYSIREIFYAIEQELGKEHPLIRQLYWRDFFTYIAFHFEYIFGHPFKQKYEQLPWNKDKKLFELWCKGQTGFPIVDAGMRQLNQTGFMHNRARLITASFLVKNLHINWLWGEQYFAQHLTDYDPSVNNGNWQWVASTGTDAQPYFRIFNPWLQQKKFDPDCDYIKKWIPELKNINANVIHKLYNQKEPLNNYPLPIIDYQKEATLTKLIYKKISKK